MKTLLSAFPSVKFKPTPAFFPMFLSSSLLFPEADYKCRHTLQCLFVLNNSPILSGPADPLTCFPPPFPSLAMNLCLPRADDNSCGVYRCFSLPPQHSQSSLLSFYLNFKLLPLPVSIHASQVHCPHSAPHI